MNTENMRQHFESDGSPARLDSGTAGECCAVATGWARVVCAAMMMDDGLIVTGVRHFSPDMRAAMKRLYGDGYHRKVREQGFINTKGEFLSRSAAWEAATSNGQILKEVSRPGTLYSENLY